MIRAFAKVLCLLVWSYVAFGQSAPNPPAFDVASVKPAGPNASLGADLRISAGGALTITNVSLKNIIETAFSVEDYQLHGGPVWLATDQFDIIAKADGNPTREQMLEMLRTLLNERFELKVRYETRKGSAYALIKAKNGPKLKPPTGETASIRFQRTGSPERPALTYILAGQKVSVPMIAAELGRQLHRPVRDRTGIEGDFDFRLEFAPTDSQSEAAPSLLTAVQEQLGLQLESAKSPVVTLVIDHVAKPSKN